MISLNSYITNKVKLIEDYMRGLFPEQTEIPNFYDAMKYAIFVGGKRLRPILTFIACELSGGDIKRALPYAAVIEIIHNFTLVHDDIEDEDTVRRNMPAVWVKYGLDNGINIGDGMFSFAIKHLLDCEEYTINEKIKLLSLVINTTLEIFEGQALDMSFRRKDYVTEEEYMRMIHKKTGVLLSAALLGGAIIAKESNEKVLKALELYGKYIGPAFQIRDDIIDLTEGKGRGAIGNDIKEGKRSLLVIDLLSKCTSDEKARVLEILNKPREETTDNEVQEVINLMKKYNSIKYAEKRCIELKNKAIDALKNIDNSNEYKSLLIQIAEFIVFREK